jgi:2-C-methyl-D-erythritol 4-phosphate cytidylyltransferase
VEVWAIVLAAGAGSRFNGLKQFSRLGETRLVDRALAAAASACDAVVVVIPAGMAWDGEPVAAAVAGGATRSDSVRSGLSAVPRTADIMVVHDAAHPLAPPALFESVIQKVVEGADGAAPAVPITETVKRVQEDRVTETVPRGGLVLVQTPQAFRASVLREAHAQAGFATDDSVLVEALGRTVALVPGEPNNLHVTTPRDLQLAAQLLGAG